MTRIPKGIKDVAIAILSTLGAAFILGGIYLYYNSETRADAEVREDRIKKELREELSDKQTGIQRELDVIHKKVDRIDDKIDRLMEGAKHGHRPN